MKNKTKIIVNLNHLPFPAKTVTMVCGYFDLLHAGHVEFLKKCRGIGNPLLVVVYTDDICRIKKPNRPVINEKDRTALISELECVDWVFVSNRFPNEENGALYRKIAPKTVVFSKAENSNNIKNKEVLLLRKNFTEVQIKYVLRQRSDISTTQIIDKITNKTNVINAQEKLTFLTSRKKIQAELIKQSLKSNAPIKNAALILNNTTAQLMAAGFNYHPSFKGKVIFHNKKTVEYIQNLPRPMHAEMSAVINFMVKYNTLPNENYTLYSTSLPCAGCAEFLRRVNIKSVRYFKGFDNNFGELILLSSQVDIKKF